MIKKTNQRFSGSFIIPFDAGEDQEEQQNRTYYLSEALEGLFSQTDQDWFAIVIVDTSPSDKNLDFLMQLKTQYYPKIDIIFLSQNVGPGISRNLGVLAAVERGSSIILFNDADDVSHPKRLEVVKKIFNESPETDVVYSTFTVIDENNRLVPLEKISLPIVEILESYLKPLEGKDTWIKMGTETGIVNITSSTAVRIKFAYQCPFPGEKASEDFHTWMRMSAFGANFKYTSLIPTKYRIPSYMHYQSSRTKIGQNNFNQIKARVDSDGFSKAIEVALLRDVIKPEEIPLLKSKFYKRLAKTMERQMENKLVNALLDKAKLQEYESSIYSNHSAFISG